MIKVSRLADYAVVILATMVDRRDQLMTTAGISQITHLPEPTVAKILKLLAKEDLLISVRGASGGYKLAFTPTEISVADIVSAIDGPIALTPCVDNHASACGYETCCPVKGRWNPINAAIQNSLENITLADMTA